MFFKTLLLSSTFASLTFLPIWACANDNDNRHDAEYKNGVLSVPRVISGDTLYKNVKLQLDFNTNIFALLGFEESPRFTSKLNGIDEILTDNINQRTWVNGSHGCRINADAAATAQVDANEHCEMLEFAGYTDWRAPTSVEIADMIVQADKLGVQLNYRNPDCQFMAASDGFVQTENTREPGKIVETAVNSGTRCVRDSQ